MDEYGYLDLDLDIIYILSRSGSSLERKTEEEMVFN